MSGHGGGGGDERWLVSYADFITLLMVLFVVLYSMGQTDIQRYKQLADSLRDAFSGGPAQIIDPGINQGSGSDDDNAPAPIIIPGIPQAPVKSVEVAGQLTEMLSASNLGGSVSVQNNIEGVLISLSEKLIFAPGTAQLQPEAVPVLETIVQMIQALDNEIRIVGHTDNSAPVDASYVSNWELSFGRALMIAQYFQANGILGERLIVTGRGEYQPIFPNDTVEHRMLNGRAEIMIVYPVYEDVINLDLSINPNKNEIPLENQP